MSNYDVSCDFYDLALNAKTIEDNAKRVNARLKVLEDIECKNCQDDIRPTCDTCQFNITLQAMYYDMEHALRRIHELYVTSNKYCDVYSSGVIVEVDEKEGGNNDKES